MNSICFDKNLIYKNILYIKMETNTIIIMVILFISVLVLIFSTYSYKSSYDTLRDSLGKDSVTLESLLAKVKAAESQQKLSQTEIENNRKQ